MAYVGAPYNFVPFPEKLMKYPEKEAPGHDEVFKTSKGENLYSGEISLSLKALTPVFVGSGKKSDNNIEEFYTNAENKPAIPGSSVRGLIRSNVQALSMSSYSDDVDDYSLMFRNVASGPKSEKDRYASILGADTISYSDGGETHSLSILKKVRAGYLHNNGGKYEIYDTGLDQITLADGKNLEDMNYYVLSERKIAKSYVKSIDQGTPFDYPLFRKNGKWITQHKLDKQFDEITRNWKGIVSTHYIMEGEKRDKDELNPNYKPYMIPCSYKCAGKDILKVDIPGKLPNEGFAVSSGSMIEKKAVYIIPAEDPGKKERFDEIKLPITISQEDVKAFRIDLKKRETTLKRFGGTAWFDLPQEGKSRPVFYIIDGNRVYFGFTPRLRLFYDHTIKDGMKESSGASLDYAKALFGYSEKKANGSSYKSRLSFGDFVCKSDFKRTDDKNKSNLILAEPKPTSYLDYLVQNDHGAPNSYNSERFLLRGAKQYWLRKETFSNVPKGKENKEYVSHFVPMPKKTEFTGKVRFHNLKKEELGLLIWAIRLEEGSVMNIGKGKAYGYGAMRPSIGSIKIFDKEKICSLDKLVLDPLTELSDTEVSEYIDSFKNVLKNKYNKNPEDLPPIKTLLLMKDWNNKPNPDKIRPMSIDQREYQNRKQPLQKAEEVIRKSNR